MKAKATRSAQALSNLEWFKRTYPIAYKRAVLGIGPSEKPYPETDEPQSRNPRALGRNPRTLGTNPRALKTNPRSTTL